MSGPFESEISGVRGGDTTGVDPDFLKKIWHITDEQAKGVVERNTQLNRQTNEGLLSRQFSTNDRMLCYCCINSCFFTDTLFVTKAAKSIQGYTMIQLFVSDKNTMFRISS